MNGLCGWALIDPDNSKWKDCFLILSLLMWTLQQGCVVEKNYIKGKVNKTEFCCWEIKISNCFSFNTLTFGTRMVPHHREQQWTQTFRTLAFTHFWNTSMSHLLLSIGPCQCFVWFPWLLPLANGIIHVCPGSQVMPSHITNPGDAEEKRYSCHRVDCVTLDSAHHRLAPKRHSAAPGHPQGYAPHRTAQCCTSPLALHLQCPEWSRSLSLDVAL